MKLRHLSVACAVGLAACTANEATNLTPPRQAVGCLYDVSSSIRATLREAAREVCVQVLEDLEDGWASVRIIGARSFLNEAGVLQVELGDAQACGNVFSAACRRRAALGEAERSAQRRAAVEALRSYRPDASAGGATDLEGALAAIDDELGARSDSTWRRTVLIASDLVPSRSNTAPVRLEHFRGAEVLVFVQSPPDPREGRQIRASFESRMRAAGARSVQFFPLMAIPER